MSRLSDDEGMQDLAWADRLLAGDPVDDDGGLVGVVAAVRATAEGPAPAPTAALAAVFRDGLPPVESPSSLPQRVRRWSSRGARVALVSGVASLVMGAGVATAAVSGMRPLDYVPEPVRRGVDAAVTAVADAFTPRREADEPAVVDEPAAPSGGAETTAPATRSATPSPAPSASTTPRPTTPAPAPLPSPSPADSAEPTPTPSASPQPSEEPSPTGSPSPDGSPEPSVEPSPVAESSPTAAEDEPSPAPGDENRRDDERRPVRTADRPDRT